MLRKEQPRQPDDELTLKLRAAARKRRPLTIRGVLMALMFLLVPAGLFVWWVYPRPEPGRLEIVAFDQLALPEAQVTLRASLATVEPQVPQVRLDGYPVFFEDAAPQAGKEKQSVKAISQDGAAAAAWRLPPDQPVVEFLARYPGDKRRRPASDGAHIFMRPVATPLLVVDVRHTLTTVGDAGWRKMNILDIPAVAEAGKALEEAQKKMKHQVVYLATHAEDPLAYRKARGWVEDRISSQDPFPAGPVLTRGSFSQEESAARQEILRHLKERFSGPITAVVGQGEAAAVSLAVGVHTILIGDGEAPAEVIRLATWAEVANHLEMK